MCLFGTGCNVVADFGDFNFGSGDAGDQPNPMPDSGHVDMPMNNKDAGMPPMDAGGMDAGNKQDSGDVMPKLDAAMMCMPTKEDCADRVDNDCDKLEDCDDPDCKSALRCCKPTEIPEVSCKGGGDEDCDGLVDCKDPNCSASNDCCTASGAEVGNTACSDSVDNDCDGILDCAETACAAQSVCCKATGSERDVASCADTIDNDCDGKLDCADPDCAVVAGCCQPDTVSPTETSNASCSDGKDNDCDGVTDCRDPNCESVDVCKLCTPTSTAESSCMDLIDNDCDKDRDCMDADCQSDPVCCVYRGPENSASACVDGYDNDCDGHMDCGDPECARTLGCCVSEGPETGASACSDDIDNDCNGLINCQDPGCVGVQNCCVPSGAEQGTQACNDGIDNDCDTLKDCVDPDCMGSGASCCTPTGSESTQPNDGKDNDCNGEVDIPILNAAYPTQGLPSSGREVALTFAPSIVDGAVLECMTHRMTGPNGGPLVVPKFALCPGTANTVNPFTDDDSADAGHDGAWATDVRWRFPNGSRSQIFSFKYYIHHTLHKAKRCMTSISDAQWFGKAKERLLNPKAPVFRPEDPRDTFLINPFVRVTYEPPNANNIFYAFEQDGSPHTVDMWSLRRRFALSADSRMLLIVRNYAANRSGQCFAAHFRVHLAHRTYNNNVVGHSCEAIVLNRAGAGVCLRRNGSTGLPDFADFANDSNDDYADRLGWVHANKFMWRQLLDSHGSGGGDVHGDAFEPGRNYRNFTPKCIAQPCPHPQDIFLPDRSLFP